MPRRILPVLVGLGFLLLQAAGTDLPGLPLREDEAIVASREIARSTVLSETSEVQPAVVTAATAAPATAAEDAEDVDAADQGDTDPGDLPPAPPPPQAPEPGSLLLLGSGFIALAAWRRRSRRSR